jgi:NAD(P)-dependent dehydrogenase (short-subunit alcohol dehydrogenase family)
MSGLLDGKVTMITGAASGIGADMAASFAAKGARVVIADIDTERGAAHAVALGASAMFVPLDVTSDESWARAMQAVIANWGKLDVLVNNAGVTCAGSVESISLEDWRKTLDIDLTGPFLGCRHAIGAIKPHSGAIINISSAYGIKADPDTVAYNTAKSALVLMTKSIALHCARCGYDITCNVVHPGVVRTAMMEQWLAACPDPEAEAKRWTDKHPIGRLGSPGDIGAMVAFLASDQARFITGASFLVDGGLSL